MTSRLGQKAVGIAAIVAIILLIVLIVLLWTGVGAGVFSSGNNAAKHPSRGYQVRTHDSELHRTQNDDVTMTFSEFSASGEALDAVTSAMTLLDDKVDGSTEKGEGKSYTAMLF
jgi:flagellar basal body-associated protein FliL